MCSPIPDVAGARAGPFLGRLSARLLRRPVLPHAFAHAAEPCRVSERSRKTAGVDVHPARFYLWHCSTCAPPHATLCSLAAWWTLAMGAPNEGFNA